MTTARAPRPVRPTEPTEPTASAPRTPGRPRRRTLTDLTRTARDTLTACRAAARAAAEAFRGVREESYDGTAPEHDRPEPAADPVTRPYDTGYRPRSVAVRQHTRAFVELVRAPAALTVPGDVLAGALAVGRPTPGRTLLLAASSVSLYWAGMALNDWADREEDARERPERPIPSGRISETTALAVAAGLTAAGLGLGALAGGRRVLLRRTLPLAATVWAYDLGLKHTPLGPVAMAAARALDVLHGTGPTPAGPALRAAATVGAHTWALTRLSRHEVEGGAGREPVVSLAVTAAVTLASVVTVSDRPRGPLAVLRRPVDVPLTVAALTASLYAATCARAQLAALRDPDAGRVRTAVGAGIHALLPLQGALVARAGGPRLGVLLAAGLPQVVRLARKVSPT